MIVGIMQPYFLPYLEHFRLMAACDLWVVFDTAQFTRKSWMTRNRVLNRDKGEAYISLPVRHAGGTVAVRDAMVDEDRDWRGDLFNRLRVYAKDAPHYRAITESLAAALAARHGSVAATNVALLRWAAESLGIATPIVACSDLGVEFPADCGPGEWALHIALAVKASEYRNPSGGRALFDPALYARHGLRLSFHEHRPRTYATGSLAFVPDLSVVDWMMWNPPERLTAWLA